MYENVRKMGIENLTIVALKVWLIGCSPFGAILYCGNQADSYNRMA